jgi:hypothetical protein
VKVEKKKNSDLEEEKRQDLPTFGERNVTVDELM